MGYSKLIPLGGRAVAVRELSAGEVRAWLKDLASADPDEEIDMADVLLFENEGLRLADFLRLTDLSSDELDAMSVQTELEALLAKCKEVNPRFFTALDRLLATGRMAIQQRASTPSNRPAPNSPGWFTRMFGRGHGAR